MAKAATIQDIFARNIGTFTREQQVQLQQSCVTVIGCGGLGGFVIEELSRLGIGKLNICDPDSFAHSNMNRQLFASSQTIGKNKAHAAAERISVLHKKTTVHPVPTTFQENRESLFTQTDVIVDCLDTVKSRLELAALCSKKKLPLVHGAVMQWYGQAGVQSVGSNLIKKLYASTVVPEQSAISVIACTVAVVASIQVAETCKLLLDIPSPLLDNWMSIDLKNMTFELANNIK